VVHQVGSLPEKRRRCLMTGLQHEAASRLEHKTKQFLLQHCFSVLHTYYNRITPTKSPSLFITTFSANLANLTIPLPQSHDCSCYVSRGTLARPPLWLQSNTDLYAYDFAHCPDLWHQPRLANVTCATSWGLCGITPVILSLILS
jgi:hypothetical protein